MPLRNLTLSLAALALVAAAPLFAQPRPGATTTVGINPHDPHPNAPAESMQHDRTTTTTTRTTTRTRTTRTASRDSVYNDATRLGTLLRDVQANVPVRGETWNTVAGEATALANRLYARTSGDSRRLATNARKHVRLMATAARRGEAAEARTHASEALPFVHQLIDWSAPPRR
jgi:hypothetical protein